YQMRKLGADGPSFPTIVAADASASLPHAIPGPRKLRKNGIVLIDWGARWGGYCSDLTRVVALGRMPPKLREIYQIVLDAQLAAIDAIAPGKPLKEVDAAARRLIERAGYGRQFGHSLGHGIGLDIHEMPTLSPRSDKGELEPGHVVTVEPGIYLPGIGGVRIEDDVLVTPRGAQVLSRLPKDLKSAMI
ncbi:MAG TPA: M24 family metallopeptidase, partial [Phycisphaeraceae bacterium]